MRQGLIAAACAYLIWGLFPIYWKQLAMVPATQVMAHRIVWCLLFVAAWLILREGLGWLRRLPARLLAMLAGSAVLIAVNWWLYIWAVNAGHIVETSLGYFINPLVSVLLGVLVLRERLHPMQWLAVGIAALGVLWLTWQAGRMPWIALCLAFSFGGYGLIRKLAVVPSVQGLAVESGLLFLPALAFLAWSEQRGSGVFGHAGGRVDLLLAMSGLVTALPLVLFAIGARRIPLSTIGILQYLAPSLQLICGVLLYGEPFTRVQAVGFACIWMALVLYAADSLWRTRRSAARV
ncbi:chloramphenicol-sensitive protein RarD [Fontimonas thermophila]|uniref:Chloramphenicol-sensitive protein RarD n=1 Tax=Fontimonas thermophila TaxID=1076937 RepID=A0A1I2H505_9GAMM|nr:EamA family transporter RarD [Fontimonas thermophila]SFF24479.1 chloramphenicol-sensitive protein RarD [Fontimonas thermophila]